MTETEACIALNMVPGMGPVRLRHLLETFETPQRILAAGRAALRAVHAKKSWSYSSLVIGSRTPGFMPTV